MIQFHYFVNQSYIGYPHEAAAEFGAVMLKFPNRHFDAQRAADLFDRYHREFVLAEQVGFDTVLVNEHHNAPLLSPIPNISATVLAKITSRVKIFIGGNILPTNGNPLRLAEELAMIDLISKGRAGLNLVLGWYPPDMQLWGLDVKEHSDRFEVAEEWIEIFDRLWAERKSFDYDGKNFQLKGAYNQPHGLQQRPVLLNAGRSPRGQEFAAKHCDIAFCSAHNPEMGAIKQQVANYRRDAREKFGKEIQIWMSAYVVLKDTMNEAQDYAHDYIVTQGDDAPVENIIRNNAIDAKAMPPEAAAKLAYALKAGFAGYPLVGDADHIARLFADLSDAGVDGFLLTWLDYEGGLDRFGREVLPRLEKAGLRAPALAMA